jgi:DNA processing protein
MDVFDAVVLSELLMSANARRTLLPVPPGPENARDQRREFSPEILAERVRAREAGLGRELSVAQRNAERWLRLSGEGGFVAVPFGGREYPGRLAVIDEPPPVLWVVGRSGLLDSLCVALVGSRAGSPYACEVAERLGSELADRGVTVISGLARGVDGAAHRGGLSGRASTAAVLGCGVDVVYPREHASLARQIASKGALVSELRPSTPPLSFHFPRRNRIISGLCVAVVVVEAAERSGSLITARCAADQGRDVMAVPGSVLSRRNRGGHALLKDGAKVVENADDILVEIGLEAGPRSAAAATATGAGEPDLLLRHMDAGESYDLDTLARLTGFDIPGLLSQLGELELQGRIRRSEAGRFRRLQ